MSEINLGVVVVAAVANFIIGFLFHGPVFGKLWMRLANITPTGNEKLSDMWPQMLKNFLANLVFAYALAIVYLFASSSSFMDTGVCTGLISGLLVWAGFIVTGSSMEVIWMGRSYKLWLFEIFSSLASILAMGAIIASW
jgi:hypothetical protein